MEKLYFLPSIKQQQSGKILKLILTLFILNSTFLIPNCLSQWVSALSGVYVPSLSASGNNIFAIAYYNGVYYVDKSTNNCENWSLVFNHQDLYSIGANGNYIFAGTNSIYIWGTFRSTDYGTTWSQPILYNQNVLSFAFNGNYAFTGSDVGYVNISSDNGANWMQTHLASGNVYALAVNGNYVFAGMSSGGVYLSTNNGTTWINVGLNSQSIHALSINGNYVFAGTTNNGVYLSSDNGLTWNQTSLNSLTVQSLALSGNNIFAGTSMNGVFVSMNSGGSWTTRNEGLNTSLSILCLCINNNYIIAATGSGGIYRRPLSELTRIIPITSEIAKGYSLSQNYPNPFNPSTNIKYQITKSGYVHLKIFDVLGREVAALVNEEQKPGNYEVDWNATDYPSGIYYYTLSTGEFSETRKAVLVK